MTIPCPSLRHMVLAAVLLFVQAISPSLALGMMQAGPAMTICRADGAAQTLPDPASHVRCTACPVCQAPSPMLAGTPQLPAPAALHAGQGALHAVTPAPLPALRLDARPRGPPASA